MMRSSTISLSKLELIAKEAGVSVRTVYRVLRGDNKENWTSASKRGQLIRKISRRLEYSPDASARSLRTGKKMQIAVLVRNTEGGERRDDYFLDGFEIVLGMVGVLELAGYSLTFATLGDVTNPQDAHSRIFREHLVEGLIVISQMPPDLLDSIDRLTPNCVWVHSNVWRPQNCIRRDEVHAGEETARVLLNQGYKKLAWVGPPAINPKDPDRHHSEAQRLQGVRSIAAKNNIELIEIIADDPGQMLDHHALFSDLLRPEVGVVVYSAHYASWLTQCTQSLGRIAPYDFGLVCCDDSLAIKHRWPGLSRMGFSLIHMGRQAGAMMLKNLKQKEGKGIPSVMIRDPWVPGNTAWGPQAAAYRPT